MRSFVAVFLVAVLAVPARAWETDFHYGLTKWLAVKAGFSLDDAEIIAAGAQDADEGPILPAPRLVMDHMCLFRHAAGPSRLVQQHHFPSYAPVPGMPQARSVAANDDAASRWTRMVLAVAAQGAPRTVALFRFGNSLHPLEDSWSHSGVPDIAPTCHKLLAWGHPKTRGGVLSHDADITHKHVADTEQSAQTVFEYLVELRKQLGGAAQPASWNALQPAVHEFAQAATKSDKMAWFNSDPAVPYDSYRKCFLDGISIPDGLSYRCSAPSPPPPASTAMPHPANDAEKFIQEFLQQWIVEQRIDLAMEQMDRESLAVGMGLTEIRNPALLRNMLLVWLNPDHGIANETEHGMRSDRSPELRDRLEKGRVHFPDLPSAIRVRGTDLSYFFSPLLRGEDTRAEYAATFQFHTAPRDAVSIGVARRASAWKVVSFNWVAF